MILKRFNDAGGSLGGNGKQSISAFGTALGSGHDREALRKEMLEYFKAMKSDEKVIYSAVSYTHLDVYKRQILH